MEDHTVQARVEIPGPFGLTPVQVELLLTTAARAPSLHNSLPWRFHVGARAIELHADPRRSPVVADPDGREMRMACGAALFNLQLALRAHAIRPIVTILPDRARPGLVAVVRHGGTKQPTPEHRELLLAVAPWETTLWETNGHPFAERPVDTAALHALRRAAIDEGAWLHIAADPAQQAAVRALAARAHREQFADPAFRAAFPADAPDRLSRNDFEPVIAVLSSHLSGASAEIRVGQALERVLLTASAHGLATSLLSAVVEVPHTRDELRRLIGGTGPPQAVLRIGHGRT